MHADDTSISFSSKCIGDLSNAINSDLPILSLWLHGNKLSLYVSETQSVILDTMLLTLKD